MPTVMYELSHLNSGEAYGMDLQRILFCLCFLITIFPFMGGSTKTIRG